MTEIKPNRRISGSILDFLKDYDDSTIKWLEKNTTNNSDLEDFRKRQLSLMEIINPLPPGINF